MIETNDIVQITKPDPGLESPPLTNEWLARIAAAVGDEHGIVTAVETVVDAAGQPMTVLGINFPVTYRGDFHGIPMAMVRKVEA